MEYLGSPISCYVCGGECEKHVWSGRHIYWRCLDCFTSQVIPRPSDSDLSNFYDSFHLTEPEGGIYHEVEDRMRVEFPAKVDLLLRHGGHPNSHLLDVGCGKGFFVKAATEANICAEGIDISASGVAYAVNVLGVIATAGRLEDYAHREWNQKFDIVTFWATIEHLPDPLVMLQAIFDCLKPGGILLCDTCLGNSFWEKFLPGHSQWFDAPQHLFVFSEAGLLQLLKKAGFSIIRIDTNFERSRLRRWIRFVRHALLCVSGGLFLSPLLGKHGFLKMRREAKWPIGRAMLVISKKP